MALKVAKISTSLNSESDLTNKFQSLLDTYNVTLGDLHVTAFGDQKEKGFLVVYDDAGVDITSEDEVYSFQFVSQGAISSGFYLIVPMLLAAPISSNYALISDMRLVGFSLSQTNVAYDGKQELLVTYDSAPGDGVEIMTITPDALAVAWTGTEDSGNETVPDPAAALKTDSDKIGLRVLVRNISDLDPCANQLTDVNLVLYFKRTA
jgi:hypothetical protein